MLLISADANYFYERRARIIAELRRIIIRRVSHFLLLRGFTSHSCKCKSEAGQKCRASCHRPLITGAEGDEPGGAKHMRRHAQMSISRCNLAR